MKRSLFLYQFIIECEKRQVKTVGSAAVFVCITKKEEKMNNPTGQAYIEESCMFRKYLCAAVTNLTNVCIEKKGD